MEGWLKKKSPKMMGGLEQRHFRMVGPMLSYYKTEKDKEAKGVIPLRDVAVSVNGSILELDVGYRVYTLVAADAGSAQTWTTAIMQAKRNAHLNKTEAPAWAAAAEGGAFDEDDDASPAGVAKKASTKAKANKKALLAKKGDPEEEVEVANPFGAYASNYESGPIVDADDPNATVEQLEAAHAHHAQQIGAGLQRTLRMAQATRDVGASTLMQMHEQGEQLNRIATDEAKIKNNLETSDRILRTMGSLRGAFSNMVTGQYDKKGKNDRMRDLEHEARRPGAGGGAGGASGAGPSGEAQEGVLQGDEPIDAISRLMGDLKQQAVDMNHELKAQSNQLDDLADKTDSNMSHMVKNTNRARRIAGGTPTDNRQWAPESIVDSAKASARKAARDALRGKYM